MSISSLLSQLVDIFRNWSHDTPEPYVLPAATADTLGGVKVGDRLSVTEDGTLSGAEPVKDIAFTISGYSSEASVTNCTKTPAQVNEILANKETHRIACNFVNGGPLGEWRNVSDMRVLYRRYVYCH